jgi:hypothetical protein
MGSNAIARGSGAKARTVTRAMTGAAAAAIDVMFFNSNPTPLVVRAWLDTNSIHLLVIIKLFEK